jgi:hypothetical protein
LAGTAEKSFAPPPRPERVTGRFRWHRVDGFSVIRPAGAV